MELLFGHLIPERDFVLQPFLKWNTEARFVKGFFAISRIFH